MNARTGIVPNPSMRSGTAVNRAPAGQRDLVPAAFIRPVLGMSKVPVGKDGGLQD